MIDREGNQIPIHTIIVKEKKNPAFNIMMSAVNVVKHINDLQLIGKVKNFINNQIFEKNISRTSFNSDADH